MCSKTKPTSVGIAGGTRRDYDSVGAVLHASASLAARESEPVMKLYRVHVDYTEDEQKRRGFTVNIKAINGRELFDLLGKDLANHAGVNAANIVKIKTELVWSE